MNEETLVYAMHLARSLDRQADMEKVIQRLWARLEEQQILLNSAVHELASTKKGEHESRQAYVNRWYREHRLGRW